LKTRLLTLAVVAAAAATGCIHEQKPVPRLEVAGIPEVPDIGAPYVSLAVQEDAVVRVVGPSMTCSGTLIRDDLVLTAHHCLVERERGGQHAFTSRLVPAAKVNVELGGDYLPWGIVTAKAILAPPCGEAGGRGDVAIVVLERKLVGMQTWPVRLDAPPARGEAVVPMGFGRCAMSADGIRRRTREGGDIAQVTPGTFQLSASICPGDSGGPVLRSGTNEVVGVVSLSAMDADEATRNVSVMARLDSFAAMFAQARAISVDNADPSDLPPLSCE
jgi:hypothetical protein